MNAAIAVMLAMATCIGVLSWRLIRQRSSQDQARLRAERLGRALLTLSRANRMMLSIEDEHELFREACRICVDAGHARLATVYLKDGQLAHRVASAGPAAEVLRNVPTTLDLDDPAFQTTYTARVLRDGVSALSNNYGLDAQAGRWRTEAVAEGIRAIAWVPVRRGGEPTAVLMLCAGEPDFFDGELMALLEELGADLSHALDLIDGRRARQDAVREIEAGRDRFQRLFQSAPVPMVIVSVADRRIVEANQALCQRYGKRVEDVVGTQTASHAYGVIASDRDLFYQTLQTQGRVRGLQLRVRVADGTIAPVMLSAEPMDYLGQSCVLITSMELQGDISSTS